ncbi:MAG: glycosyltransferase family 1 protein [Leptospiraceae bacterium]|nr:glycosyltransferase family 1 protein [Leptospiraceae bacterium]
MNSHRIAFFVYAHNLAETTRAIEVARACKCASKFFVHGGIHAKRITDAGFEMKVLRPEITIEKHRYLMDLDQGRRIGHPFRLSELRALVESELQEMLEYQPDALYLGMNLPTVLVARIMRKPLISVLPFAGSAPFFALGMAHFPEQFENWFTSIWPSRWKDQLFNWMGRELSAGLGRFNRILKEKGANPLQNMQDLISGNLNLITDWPEWTGVEASDLPSGYSFVGPIFADLDIALSPDILDLLSSAKQSIYCSMGSSAPPEYLKLAVEALKELQLPAVVATTSVLSPGDLGVLPEHIIARDYVPAPAVNSLASVALIHGGQGTVQTALWSGTPMVGVAFQFEQQANLQMMENAGVAIRIPARQYSSETIKRAVRSILDDPSYSENSARLRRSLQAAGKRGGALRSAALIQGFLESNDSPAENSR